MELLLCDALPHGRGRAHTARDHLLQLVDVRGSRPLLVLDDIDARLHLGLLHNLAIGTHALGSVGLCKRVTGERRCVQAAQRDELPAVAQLREPANIGLLLRGRHSRLPVEGWREVVGQPV